MLNNDLITFANGMVTMPESEFSNRILVTIMLGILLGLLISRFVFWSSKSSDEDRIRTKVHNAYDLGYEKRLEAARKENNHDQS